jgi:hypothetical protein
MFMHPEIRHELARHRHRETTAAAKRSHALALAPRPERGVERRARRAAGAEVTIRPAGPADATRLVWLATLDDVPPLEGAVLLAEVEGLLWAACSLADGRTAADPFHPTQAVRALLELRRTQIAAADGGAGREPRRRRVRHWLLGS